MEIYYEDLMENFDNKNLREKLMQLVNDNKIIIVKGLSSAQRHTVYRQMYYPLKFEKIMENDDTNIKIYNYKIKDKKKMNEENKNEENKNEENKKSDEDSEPSDEDSEYSSTSNTESYTDSTESTEFSDTEDDSYNTDEEDGLTKIENMTSQFLEQSNDMMKYIKSIKKTTNFILFFNIIGWIIFYMLDHEHLTVYYGNKEECIN